MGLPTFELVPNCDHRNSFTKRCRTGPLSGFAEDGGIGSGDHVARFRVNDRKPFLNRATMEPLAAVPSSSMFGCGSRLK